MNGVPQSGADRCATAKSCVGAYWSNGFTVPGGLGGKTLLEVAESFLQGCNSFSRERGAFEIPQTKDFSSMFMKIIFRSISYIPART